MRSAILLHRHAMRSRLLAAASAASSTSTVASAPLSTLSNPSRYARCAPAASSIGGTSCVDRPLFGPFSARQSQQQFRFLSTNNKDAEEGPDEKEVATKKTNKKPLLLNLGIPSLVPEWKNMFNPSTLLTDISAGITVGCIAVPLSLAIALASGVPAEVGLVTAAVSGIAGGLLGGTTLAVTGPAAAISLLVVGAVQAHGLEALPFITLATGGLQLASGVTRVGVVAKLVPVSVIAGFTVGVGTLILSGQVPKALGMSAPAGLNPVELIGYVGSNLSAIDPASAALAIGTSAAMFGLPKIHPKIPSALIAVGGATAATHVFGLDVALIGTLPSGLDAFQFGFPVMPSTDAIPSLVGTTLLIYSMTSVESLLSCAALEKMKKTSYKHNPDQELIGQGLANIGSGFFMGMPVTSVIARSGLNVRLNASTRLPALVQAGFVFSSVAFMSSSIATIPMPALSGVLITTGIGMLNPVEFKHCYAVQKADAVPFATTIAGMLSMGLAEGIGIGCVTALAMELKNNGMSFDTARMSIQEHIVSTPLHLEDEAGSLLPGSYSGQHTFKLNGPINFVSMFEIDDLMERIKDRHYSHEDPIVLDLKGVTALEFTGVEELVNRLVEVSDGVPVQMINCTDVIHSALDQCDPTQQISRFATTVEA
jgi:MFS superfamily sulfate permease-like transporter